jgi:hypothetical protein
MVGPVPRNPVGVDHFRGWHHRARCCPCIIEWFASTSTCTFPLWNFVVSNLESKIVIFYIKGISFMVCMCILVYSYFNKNPSIWSWLTTCHSAMGVQHRGSSIVDSCRPKRPHRSQDGGLRRISLLGTPGSASLWNTVSHSQWGRRGGNHSALSKTQTSKCH